MHLQRIVRFLVSMACLGGVFAQGGTAEALGQEQAEPAVNADAAAKLDAEAANAEFQKKLTEWRSLLKELRTLKVKYQTATEGEDDAIKQQWDALIAKGEELIPGLRGAGKAAYEAAPNVDLQLARTLFKFVEDDVDRDDYEPAFELAEVLIAHNCEFKEIYNLAAIAAFCTNQLDKSEEYFKKAEELGALSPEGQRFRPFVAKYVPLWEAEQAARAREAAADDLPRVKLTTSRGVIVLELFENEAPETVGNFISLVSNKFYDGLSFHRVLKGFMAQGGCPRGDGSGGPGYKIYCECSKAGFRSHFRGSLSMAKETPPDTGGSQFFLTFVPTAHLNGQHTVFGRVIEGMDVLAKLTKRDPMGAERSNADVIVTAEVIRQRPDKKYEPNKVQ